MSKKRTRKPVPLDRDSSGRYLPLLVAIMVYLASLALAGGLSMGKLAERWDTGLTGALTIQVPADAAAAQDEAAMSALLAEVTAFAGVTGATAMAGSEIAALLEPWLGDSGFIGELPLPRLIAVTIDPAAGPDIAALRQRLEELAPGSLVDDHQQWLAKLLDLARAVEVMAAIVVALVIFAACIMVAFVTRMGLAAHEQAIELLHLIGAQDSYVARQFQNHALSHGLRGGLLGLALAVPTLYLVRYLLQRIDSGLLPELTLRPHEWSLLILLPVAAALITMITARITVMRTLARMP